MPVSKKYQHYENFLIKGKLRRNGFEKWRYVCTGINKNTGDQKTFFIELYLVNPGISPKSPVLAQKSRLKINANDLQYALAGTVSAQSVSSEFAVQPSYVLLKAGYYGKSGRQMNKFYAASSLVWSKQAKAFLLEDCVFSNDTLSGAIEVSREEIQNHPEYFCSAGKMDWNLHFEKNTNCGPLANTKTNFWIPCGVKTVFAGIIHIDNQEYSILPRTSSGYYDRSWGSEVPNPFYHLSSSNLTSVITGRPLVKSSFAVEGEYDGRLSIYVNIEGEEFSFSGNSFFNKYSEIHNWSQMPKDGDGEKLHWTVSIHKKKMVIDMDIFCKTEEMFVRDYEIPEGNRKLLKILGGGTGFGEIRFYKKVGKNLELLEHANVIDSVCEYGNIDQIDE